MISYRQSDLFKKLQEFKWMKNPFMHPNEFLSNDWDLERMGKKNKFFKRYYCLGKENSSSSGYDLPLKGDSREDTDYFYNKEFDIIVLADRRITNVQERLADIYRLLK